MSDPTIFFFLSALIGIALLMNLLTAKGKSNFWHRTIYLGMVCSGSCMVCWAIPPLRSFADYFMYAGMALMLNFIWIDYFASKLYNPADVADMKRRNRPLWVAGSVFVLSVVLSLAVESYQRNVQGDKAQMGIFGMVYRLIQIGERLERKLDEQTEHDRKRDIRDSVQTRQIQRNTDMIRRLIDPKINRQGERAVRRGRSANRKPQTDQPRKAADTEPGPVNPALSPDRVKTPAPVVRPKKKFLGIFGASDTPPDSLWYARDN